ncbi:MAG: hypothetical protein K2X47_18420 [Bdellovibrionales bacterium]|nr:hypothetical protein [Bdellovibrionales bacterium]
MISWQTSKSGLEIPVVDGNVLASRYDPRREALLFLKPFEASLQDKETVFLLGAGNVFVVQELRKQDRVPFVIVMDPNADLVTAMAQRHSDDRVRWSHISSFDFPDQLALFKKYFLTNFKVLVSPSAQFIDSNWIQSGQSFLNGHSVEGFRFQKDVRKLGEGSLSLHLLSNQEQGPFGKLKALEMIRDARRGSDADDLTQILGELVV